MLDKFRYERGFGVAEDGKRPADPRAAAKLSKRMIPPAVSASFEREHINELGGTWGDPSVGDPVEVDYFWGQIEGEEVEITVFNRGIALFTTDEEEIRRLHRFFCAIAG